MMLKALLLCALLASPAFAWTPARGYNDDASLQVISIPAAGCNNTTSSGVWDLPTSGAASSVCIGTTTTSGSLVFPDGSTTAATTHFELPPDWSATDTAIGVVVYFTNSTNSANPIRWQVSIGCVGTDDSVGLDAPTYGTASAADVAGTATAGRRRENTFAAVASASCAASETLFLKIERIGANAGDTNTGDGRLFSVVVRYKVGQ